MEKSYQQEIQSMTILDTNYILRFLLRDDEEMFLSAKEVISNQRCLILDCVLAEVVYVLSGVYNTPKSVITKTLSQFLSLENISMQETASTYITALQLYETRNLDFVDCCLCSYKNKFVVKSFDKKLSKCLKDEGF